MDAFMKRAVELSAQNVNEGGQPFGAVLVKDGKVLAEGVNELHLHFDSSGHAEMLAIREAQEKLQTLDLSEAVMYASGEPCPMCYTMMYYAGIREGYYCASVEETAEAGLGASTVLYDDFTKPREERTVVLKQMKLEANQTDPMELFQNRK
ncbi:nucleoside deaminase [Ornithinibacillus gellani]|uniref:nucleoside deaminase n=1 Tax=Ornithinibacillus gellani TaxID=2293253 RepID=UPI000F4AB8F2|nr:nucleoside deaminase [Ornithinibacillus gellani]TQS76515.1 nucleoside deaminase [Ornithinibacillus gellani]